MILSQKKLLLALAAICLVFSLASCSENNEQTMEENQKEPSYETELDETVVPDDNSKAKAEEEAREKAKAEAKAQAEEEAREKAKAEAKAQAEAKDVQEAAAGDMDEVWAARHSAMHDIYVGTWTAYSWEDEYEIDTIDFDMRLVLNDDGTGYLIRDENKQTFTWESGSTMNGTATAYWDELEYEYMPISFDMQILDDDEITADLGDDQGYWIVYFRK